MSMILRRDLIGSFFAGSIIGAQGLSALASNNSKADAKSIDSNDKRVKAFLEYVRETEVNPNAAVSKYLSSDVIYYSTTGQAFNINELTERLQEWSKGFAPISRKFNWAAELPDGLILISATEKMSQVNKFRGADIVPNPIALDQLWIVSYERNGKIGSYQFINDYKNLSLALKPKDHSKLMKIK